MTRVSPLSRRSLLSKTGVAISALQMLPKNCGPVICSPEDFREPGDSDRIALQKLADRLSASVHGRIDRDYQIDRQIEITDKTDFVLSGAGSIKLMDGVTPEYGGSALYLAGCRNFQIEDILCDGNRANREAKEAAGHLIVLDACSHFTLRRVKANNGTSDGFIIHTSRGRGTGPQGAVTMDDIPSNWLMEGCEAHKNFRQGLSVIESMHFRIKGGAFTNTTGSWDEEGTRGPSAGIDLEPDEASDYPSGRLSNGVIEGVSFANNQGAGLQIAGIADTHSIFVKNCKFDGNRKAAIICGARDCQFLRPTISRWSNAPYVARSDAPPKRGAIDLPVNAGPDISIVEPHFVDCVNGADADNPLIYVHGLAGERVRVLGLRTDASPTFVASLHSPGVSFIGAEINLAGASMEPAFVFLGEAPVFADNNITNVFKRLIYSAADHLSVERNVISVRLASRNHAIIAASEGTRARVVGNILRFKHEVDVVEYDLPRNSTVNGNKSYGNASTSWIRAPAPIEMRNNLNAAI